MGEIEIIQANTPELDGEMLLWLLTKPTPKLVGKMCQSHYHDHDPAGRCTRPVWGDGRVNGDFYGFCSRCWHVYAAFHSPYTTFRANPASLLNSGNVERLRFLDQTLPEIGAERPDTFPKEWL